MTSRFSTCDGKMRRIGGMKTFAGATGASRRNTGGGGTIVSGTMIAMTIRTGKTSAARAKAANQLPVGA